MKLYRVTFESEIVVASDHADRTAVEDDVARMLRESDLGDELADAGAIVSVQRILRGGALPGNYALDHLPWTLEDDDRTIGEILADQPEDPLVAKLRELRDKT